MLLLYSKLLHIYTFSTQLNLLSVPAMFSFLTNLARRQQASSRRNCRRGCQRVITHLLAAERHRWSSAGTQRDELERLSKDELIELVLRLQRPAKASHTSSKPPSTDRKARREQAKPGGAKPGHKVERVLSPNPDRVVDHAPQGHKRACARQCPGCGPRVVAAPPPAATGTPFGPRLHAVATSAFREAKSPFAMIARVRGVMRASTLAGSSSQSRKQPRAPRLCAGRPSVSWRCLAQPKLLPLKPPV